ncbi:MAG: hypothetical protein ACRBHB_25765 [Arenicella sp.]
MTKRSETRDIEGLLRQVQQQAWLIRGQSNPAPQQIRQLRDLADQLPGRAHAAHKVLLDELVREVEVSLDTVSRNTEPELLRSPEVHIEQHFDSRYSTRNSHNGMMHGGTLIMRDTEQPSYYQINASRFHQVTLIKKIVFRPFSFGEVITRTALGLSITRHQGDPTQVTEVFPDKDGELIYSPEMNPHFYNMAGMQHYESALKEAGDIGHSYTQRKGKIYHRHYCSLMLTKNMLSHVEYFRKSARRKTEKAAPASYSWPESQEKIAGKVDSKDAFNPYFNPDMQSKGEGVIFQSPYLKIIALDDKTRPVIISYLAGYKKTSNQTTGSTRKLQPQLFFL